MRCDSAISIDYSRQFRLLAAVTVAWLLIHRWLPVLGAVPSVGLYGVIHSAVLAAFLRPPPAAWRKALFIMGASGLAMLSVMAARFASQLLPAIPGMRPPAALLTLSSGLGAVSYGLLIRRFWVSDLPRRALVCITLCCALSTLIALPLGTRLHSIGGWWFAMIWWWAFSVALCYCDARVFRIEVPACWVFMI